MLRTVMSKRHIAERLLEERNGERALTDLMHIGEQLQQARQELDSDYGLLRWLSESIQDANQGFGGSDDDIQRLESERNLVQIVTIHKSKGLEYDLVFLPFANSYREASEGKYYDESIDGTMLDITSSQRSLVQADKERLAEDLRLIYVALTRAVYGCFVGLAPLRNGRSIKEPTGVHKSAIGYLIQNGARRGIAEYHSDVSELVQVNSSAHLMLPPEKQEDTFVLDDVPTTDMKAKELHAHIDRAWRITSYSGLVKQSHTHHANTFDATNEMTGFDIDSADDQQGDIGTELMQPERSIFNFPRGARPGTFLHTLFEEIEFTQPASGDGNSEVIRELLAAEQYEAEWLPILQQLVDTVLATPLDGKALCLNQKQPNQILVEMEFLLPIEVLSSPALNRIIQYHDILSAKAGELGFSTVQGMLKGFIDLVFEHEGKYYVLDWKSNHLGDDASAYHGEALKSAMADHRYDLQYQIYALALHRFLRSRIANYDFQTHFGGVYYLFLRGMDGQSEQGVFSAKPSEQFLSELDRLIDGVSMSTIESERNTRSNDDDDMQMELGL